MRALPLALLLLSGCLVQQPAPSDAPGPPEAMESTILLQDCSIVEAFATAEAAVVRPHVPDDFSLVLDGSGRAALVLGGLVCEGDVAQRGLLAVLVDPVADLHAGEGVNHFWEPEHLLVPETELSAAFAMARANATSAVEVRAVLAQTEGLLVMDMGDRQHRIQSIPGVVPADEAGSVFGHFREYAAGDGGYVYLEAEFAGDADSLWGGGLAMVTTAQGTVSRELIGAEAALPFVAGAGLEYADAKVGFVPR